MGVGRAPPGTVAQQRCTELGVAAPAVAQDSTSGNAPQIPARTPSELARRSSGTVSFVQSRPLGGLSENIGFGYGLKGAYLLRLDHAG